MYSSIKSPNNPGDIHFTATVKVFSNPAPNYQSTIDSQYSKNQSPGLIIYKHSTRTNLPHHACKKTLEKLTNPGGNTRKFWSHFLVSFP